MKRLLLFLIPILLFCGCSPQKRIARIAEKYNLIQYDKVIFRDTLIIPSKTIMFQTVIDSLGNFYQKVNNNEIFGNIHDSVITVRVIPDADTIIIEKPIDVHTIKVNKVEKVKPYPIIDKMLFFLFGLCCLCVVIIILYFVFKREKKQS